MSDLGPYERMTNAEKRDFFRERETREYTRHNKMEPVLNQYLTEEALTKREEWELCAPNAYQMSDIQVIDMIREIRRLRAILAATESMLD